MRRKFSATKIGHVITFPSLEPSKHNVFKFAWIIRFIGLVRHLKMSFYHVLYICQYHRSSLYNVLFCTDIQWFFCSIIYFKNLACQCLTFYFISSNAGKTNRLIHIDSINFPSQARMPIDGLQDASRCGRCHHVVRISFYF